MSAGRSWRWVAIGGAVVGTLDLVFACTWWNIAKDVPPVKIMQSIASGLLGQDAYDGGAATAVLGVALHYFIATTMVLTYTLVSGRIGALVRRPLVFGPLYGLVLYGVMEFVVVPLSRHGVGKFNVPWEAASVAANLVYGTVCAVAARRALSRA